MRKYLFLIFTICLFLFACAKNQVIEDRDNFNRTIRLSYYNEKSLDHIEDISYKGDSNIPTKVIYKLVKRSKYIPYKMDLYVYSNSKPKRITTYNIKGNQKHKVGQINYYYAKNEPKRIEFYRYIKDMNKMFIFGLYQYSYKENMIDSLRIIGFEYNPATKKSMQVEQHLVFYNKGTISHMRSLVMAKKSKKILEINENDAKQIKSTIESVEKRYRKRSKG